MTSVRLSRLASAMAIATCVAASAPAFAVERGGLEMLARYALWSGELADALALRLAALEAADVVFRVAHQLHGAVGFCDETTLSWLSRHSQPLRRLPWGLSATRELLADAVEAHGLTGLYSA